MTAPPVYTEWAQTRRNLATAGGQYPLGSVDVDPGPTWDGDDWDWQVTVHAPFAGTRIDLNHLTAEIPLGATLYASWEYGNPGAASIIVGLDIGDSPIVWTPVAAGGRLRASDNTVVEAAGYRFVDASVEEDEATFLLRQLVVDTAPIGDYFDGDNADTDLARYTWLGTPGASVSIEETRTLVVPEIPPTRHSAHTARAVFVNAAGHVTDVGEVDCSLNLDEGLSPYGDASLTVPLTADNYDPTDPLLHRGLRLQLELRESVGDPVIASEVTADLGGSVAAFTAGYGPALTPAKITSTYFVPWNPADARPGSSIRADLLVTSREVDHAASRMSFRAATDEAALQAYKLVSKTPEISDSLKVSDTVNFALRKIGAALQPGGQDATIQEGDATVWDPGVSGWDYVSNVAEASGLVVRCGLRRQWTLELRDQPPPRWDSNLPDVVNKRAFTAVTERVDLDTNLWAEAVVVRYSWVDRVTGDTKQRVDTASTVSRPVKVVTIDRDTPYPGAGSAAYWLKRLRGRGRVFELEEVGDYTLRPGTGITAWMPAAAAHTGAIEAVTWAAPSDRGMIRTRDTLDLTGNVIDLWPAGVKIDAVTGKIDAITVLTGD